MIFVFFGLAGVLLIITIVSRKKYISMTDIADINVFRMKSLLSGGLMVLDFIKYNYCTAYDRKLLAAITESFGSKNSMLYLKLHWSNKVIFIYCGLIFSAFVGSVSATDTGFLIFSGALLGGIFYFTDKELFDRVKKRRSEIRFAFPDFANKLVLLINAGMTVTRAWEKISNESKKATPLQREVCTVIQDIRAGKPEHSAYEDFAKRCRTPEITRFISVILQNLRKGNGELVPVLRIFTNECWEMRKNIAKKFGEEASTKMILPLMLMFAAILLIVGAPAVLALRNI